MAIYCSVCATSILSGQDNFGSIPVTREFKGWDIDPYHNPRIDNTCFSCYNAIARFATEMANSIVDENQSRVDKRRAELAAQKATEEKRKKDEYAFLIAWEKKQRESE